MLVIYKKSDGRVMGCFSDENQSLDTLYPNNEKLRNELDSKIFKNKRDLIDMNNYCVIDGELVRNVEPNQVW